MTPKYKDLVPWAGIAVGFAVGIVVSRGFTAAAMSVTLTGIVALTGVAPTLDER